MSHLQAILDRCGQPGPRCRDALGLIERVPWTRKLRVQRKLPKQISLGDANAALTGSPEWMLGYSALAYNLGLRYGVLSRLEWKYVDLAAKTLRIPAKIDKCGGDRAKPCNSFSLRWFLKLRTNTQGVLKLPGRRRFYETWRARGALRPHDLKRLCATELAKVASSWAVRHMLDHAQYDVTGGHYVHPWEELKEAAERLPQIDAWSF